MAPYCKYVSSSLLTAFANKGRVKVVNSMASSWPVTLMVKEGYLPLDG